MNTHEQKASATGAVGVFEGYVDDVPLVRWLDRSPMPQPGEHLYSHAFVDKLLTIIAAAYQIAGAHDAPANILDVLADPEGATAEQVDAMLPYQPIVGQVQDETKPAGDAGDAGVARTCRSSEIVQAVLSGQLRPLAPSTTGIYLDKLEALARAATPGPWSWWTSNSFLRLTADGGPDGGVLHSFTHRGNSDIACSTSDQAFIAAANPAAVLALIAIARQATPARQVGIDLADCLAERGPDPTDGGVR